LFNRLKPKSEFSRNVLTLMTGTSIAQAIPIAISPILTRIYTPEEFGAFALYMSLATTLSVIATGRYELAIMLPKKDDDAANIVALSIIFAFIVSFLSFLIIHIFNAQITLILGNPKISLWLYFIPITVLLTGIYQSLNYWTSRKKQYKHLATNKVLQSTTIASTNLGMGVTGFGNSGLILGQLSGLSIATIMMGKLLWKEDSDRLKKIKRIKMFALLKKYSDFPKINMFQAFINDFKNLIVNILLTKYYNSFILGQFYMVNKILLLPSGLIGSSISQVLYKDISDKYNSKEDFSKDILYVMIKLFLFALIPFFIIVLFGKEIFGFILGENWEIAGDLASSFALYILFHFVASPISIIPFIVQKQGLAFYWNLGGTLIYIFSISMGGYLFHNLPDALLLTSIIMSIYFFFYFMWIYNISKKFKKYINA